MGGGRPQVAREPERVLRPLEQGPQPAWQHSPHPQAVHITGPAGSVCLMDCRLWCALPAPLSCGGGSGGPDTAQTSQTRRTENP